MTQREMWVVLLGSRTQGYGTARAVGTFESLSAAGAWTETQPEEVREMVLGAYPLHDPDAV